MKKIIFAWCFFILGISAPVVALVPDFTSNKVCLGQATTLVDNSTPADSIEFRLWDLDGDGYFNNDTGKVVTHIFSSDGNHNVGLKIVTYSGTAKAIYKFVTVTSVTVSFSFIPNCNNQPVQFFEKNHLIEDSVLFRTWNFGDGGLQSHEPNPVHYFMSAGEYITTYSAVTLAGCTDTTSLNVIIPPLPEYSLLFSGDTSKIIDGSSIYAFIDGERDSLLWSTNEKSDSIAINQEGDYWVRVFRNGCYMQTDFHITVKQYGSEPVITTLFTPNGDGYNDYWEILNLPKVGPCVVNVFDRWGTEVYSNNEYQNNWNGTSGGKNLTNDIYYYFVRCLYGKLYKGTVNILK